MSRKIKNSSSLLDKDASAGEYIEAYLDGKMKLEEIMSSMNEEDIVTIINSGEFNNQDSGIEENGETPFEADPDDGFPLRGGDFINRTVIREFNQEAFIVNDNLENYFDENIQLVDHRFEKEGILLYYPIGEINKELYNSLANNYEWMEYFGPKGFFDVLYDLMRDTLASEDHINFPDNMMRKINESKFSLIQRGYIVFGLIWIIKRILVPIDIKPNVIEKHPKYRPLFKIELNLVLLYGKIKTSTKENCLPRNISIGQPDTDKEVPLYESKQIAYIYFYNGHVISRENAQKIAAKYNRVKKTSGQELYQDYTAVCKFAYRIGRDDSERQIRSKIKTIRSILDQLSGKAKARAINELKELEDHI